MMNTDYVSKDMRLTTLGPVRYSIKKEKEKKKSPSCLSLTDEELVQSPDMNMKRSGKRFCTAPQKEKNLVWLWESWTQWAGVYHKAHDKPITTGWWDVNSPRPTLRMFKQTKKSMYPFFFSGVLFWSVRVVSWARVAEAAGSFRGRPADCRCGRPARASCWSASYRSPHTPPSWLCPPPVAPPPGWSGTPAPSPGRPVSAPPPPVSTAQIYKQSYNNNDRIVEVLWNKFITRPCN